MAHRTATVSVAHFDSLDDSTVARSNADQFHVSGERTSQRRALGELLDNYLRELSAAKGATAKA